MLVGICTLALITSPALASVCSSSDKKDCKSANDWEKRGRNVCEEKANYLTCLAGKGCFLEESECHDLFDPCKKPLPAVCFAPSDASDAPSSSPSGGGGGGFMGPEDGETDYLKYPPHAPFFGFMGAAAALVFANMGAAYGTAKSGRGISTMGVLYPSLVMKHIIPVVMAGVLGIYGLIIAVIIGNGVVAFKAGVPVYSAFKGFAHLGGGLACGLSGLAAGMAIGIVGDYGVRSAAEQPKLYVGMVLVLIFSEALGLYGLIVGLILTSKD